LLSAANLTDERARNRLEPGDFNFGAEDVGPGRKYRW
jgi:hypothetical protein